MLGCTDRTVRDYLGELRDAGFLKVQRRGRGRTNVYRIVHAKLTALPPEKSSDQDADDRNDSSDLDRNQASGEEYEVEKTKKPPAAAPRKRAPNEQWDALKVMFGEPTVPTAIRLRGKLAKELRDAGATFDEILRRGKRWPSHFENATLTETALVKHWDRLGRKPLRAGGR